jgi:hypothetical protein
MVGPWMWLFSQCSFIAESGRRDTTCRKKYIGRVKTAVMQDTPRNSHITKSDHDDIKNNNREGSNWVIAKYLNHLQMSPAVGVRYTTTAPAVR